MKRSEIMLYWIGVDGGGTKTETVALSLDGQSLASCIGKATNPYAVSADSAFAELASILDGIQSDPALSGMNCAGVCFGLSGVANDSEKQAVYAFLERYLAERNLSFPVAIRTEGEISLMAGIGRDTGVLVVSGTGSIAFGFTEDGRILRAGGWGHLLGDEGSGYQIGLLTLQTAMQSYDGVIPPTQINDFILQAFGWDTITELKRYIYAPEIKKADIAAFSEYCIRAAMDGDAAAQRILNVQALSLAETASALIRKEQSFETTDVVVTGSVFKHSSFFRSTFRSEMEERHPRLRITEAFDRSAAVGAALLARKLFA